jgi:putative heme-binding domain-containing protein
VVVGWSLVAFLPSAATGDDSGPPEQADRTAIALEALRRLKGSDLEANPTLKALALKVLEQVRGTPAFVEVVGEFDLKDQDPALLEIALTQPDQAAGVEAVKLILRHGAVDLLRNALYGPTAGVAVEVLGHTGDKRIVALLAPLATDETRDLRSRKQVVQALAQVQEGAAALLRLVRQGKLPADLKPTASLELNLARWPAIKTEAAQLLPLPRAGDSAPRRSIPELARMPGDPRRGAEVFSRETTACLKCHRANGQGADFGPDLSGVGAKLAKEALFEAILDPSAGIAFGYEAWQIELRDGDEAYGVLAGETADELTLKTQGGLLRRYRQNDIVKRERQPLSIMPAGLEQAMSAQDLADLVAYLGALRNAPK